MTAKNKKKKLYLKIILFILGIIFLGLSLNSKAAEKIDFNSNKKNISINDDGIIFFAITDQQTVGDFLKKQNLYLSSEDLIFPALDSKIFSNSTIIIKRAKKITIKEGGKTNSIVTFQSSIESAIWSDKNIELDEDDITSPERTLPVKSGMTITVTHVQIKEETQNQDIPFKVITNEDDSLGWKVKKVTQVGEKGIREVKYKVVYNDGKEINRKILESNVVKDPVSEIDTQGTFVKVGKASTGQASWYAYTGTLSAANPWLPLGSYVKVTNQDNGKSVIVKINDRGPFGNGRIIDLDKVAFAKIADIGSGVANVKMETILN